MVKKKIKNITLSVIAAIFVAVSVTNFLWLNDHKSYAHNKVTEFTEFSYKIDSACYANKMMVLDSLDILENKITALEATNDSLSKELEFVNSKVNYNIKETFEQAEDIYRLHAWHWEGIDSTKTVE